MERAGREAPLLNATGLAPYAGNSGLAKPQVVEIDQAQNRTHDVRIMTDEADEILLQMNGVADGIRTHDNRNHNPRTYAENSSTYGQFIEDSTPWEAALVLKAVGHLLLKSPT